MNRWKKGWYTMTEKNNLTLVQKMKIMYAKPIKLTNKNGVFKRRHLLQKVKRV